MIFKEKILIKKTNPILLFFIKIIGKKRRNIDISKDGKCICVYYKIFNKIFITDIKYYEVK